MTPKIIEVIDASVPSSAFANNRRESEDGNNDLHVNCSFCISRGFVFTDPFDPIRQAVLAILHQYYKEHRGTDGFV